MALTYLCIPVFFPGPRSWHFEPVPYDVPRRAIGFGVRL